MPWDTMDPNVEFQPTGDVTHQYKFKWLSEALPIFIPYPPEPYMQVMCDTKGITELNIEAVMKVEEIIFDPAIQVAIVRGPVLKINKKFSNLDQFYRYIFEAFEIDVSESTDIVLSPIDSWGLDPENTTVEIVMHTWTV